MKCVIDSVKAWEIEDFIDEYAKAILDAGFTLERLDETEDHDEVMLIDLESMEDLGKLAEATEHNIVYHGEHYDINYPQLTIYDDYME